MRSRHRALGAWTVWVGFTVASWAPPIAADPLRYRLAPETTYEEGCFAPCMCPIMMRGGLSGTFVAVPLEPDGSYRVFAIQQVRWYVPGFGLHVRGSGTYRIDTAELLQRLEMELQVGDDPVEHYDSGLVPAHLKFPDIAITISVHGMYCWDTAFDLQARFVPGSPRSRNDLGVAAALPAQPAGAPGATRNAPLAISSTWSAVKNLYRHPSP